MKAVGPNAHLTTDGALLHPTCREPYLLRRLTARLEGAPTIGTTGTYYLDSGVPRRVDYGDVIQNVIAHPAATCLLCGQSFGIERTKGKVQWPPLSRKAAPRWKPIKP